MALTQTRQDPSKLIGQLGQDYATQLTGLTSVPLDTSQFAPSVAAQDPLQTQAASLAASGVGGYAPYLSQAATYGTQAGATMGGVSPYITGAAGLTGTGAGTGAGSISSYMSPYQSQVIDATLSEFDKQAAMRQQSISDAAIGVGGYGGGRHGVAQAEYQTQSDKNRALLQAQMLQQGFGQGAALRQQDYQNQLGLAGAQTGLAQGQLGLGGYQSGLAQLAPQLAGGDIGTLSQVGAIQQQQAQRTADAQAQANQMMAMEPYQRLGTYGQGIGMLAPMMGSQTTQISPDPTALQTALGWTSVLGGIMNPSIGTYQAGNVYNQQQPANRYLSSPTNMPGHPSNL
jgi:hypothetical protein|tara:strand:+ start:154 stop:1182 length:1029 start_codon:yes stop_codon:yes gene_type:complete